MRITIKKSYHEETKEILKKLRPYTNYKNCFTIIFITDKDNNIKKFEVSTLYNNEVINIESPFNFYELQGQIISEIIEALNLAGHKIYFNIQGGF